MANIPNTMGAKSALTSAGMICFFVFWYLHPSVVAVLYVAGRFDII